MPFVKKLNALKLLRKFSVKNNPTSGAFIYSASGEPNSSVCHDNAGSWAAISSLRNPMKLTYAGWCVDSTGNSKESTSLPAGATICP